MGIQTIDYKDTYVLTYELSHHMLIDLIRHLYSDGHITAEEASHLESKKLFQAPTASPPTAASGAATASVIHTTPLSSDAVTRSTRSTSATNPASAVLNLIKDMSINYQSVASTGSTLNAVTTTATIAGQSTTASFSKSTTASLSQIPLLAGQVSQTISTASQPAITITPNTPLSLPQGASLRTGVLKLTTTTNQSSLQQSSLQLTDQGLPQTDNLTVGGDTSQPTSSLASSENGDSNDDHYYDDMTFDPSPEPDVVPSDNGNVFEIVTECKHDCSIRVVESSNRADGYSIRALLKLFVLILKLLGICLEISTTEAPPFIYM